MVPTVDILRMAVLVVAMAEAVDTLGTAEAAAPGTLGMEVAADMVARAVVS